MNMILASKAFNLVITIAIILLMLVLIFFMIKLILKNEKKYRDEKYSLSLNMIPQNEIKQLIENHIIRIGAFGSFTLMLIDIDDFTGLNKLYGEQKCSDMLLEYVHRIDACFQNAVISNIGKDKILVLVKNDLDLRQLDELAQDLMYSLRQPYVIGHQHDVSISASVAIALYPTCGSTYKELLRSLELTNYVLKRNGGNNYMIYSSDIDQNENTNMEFYKEIRDAIDNGEFTLFYQPIVNVGEKKLFGFETFLRWNHPQQGVLAPNKFIHLLEASGDISYITKWGLEQIFDKIEEIQSKIGANDLVITNNISVKQLMNDKIVDDFRKVLRSHSKINPKKIALEIGEYSTFEKMDVVKVNLLRLRDLGFRISVDGLGLDYSTLSQIEKAPLDIIKLDSSFLKDINNNFMQEKFVQMLAESALQMDRIVIAEGVETFEHTEYICKNAVQYAQGYYFSKPFPSELVYEYIVSKDYIQRIEKNSNDIPTLIDTIKNDNKKLDNTIDVEKLEISNNQNDESTDN